MNELKFEIFNIFESVSTIAIFWSETRMKNYRTPKCKEMTKIDSGDGSSLSYDTVAIRICMRA